jgi:two-component system, LuxR family, sensor kinase FixL
MNSVAVPSEITPDSPGFGELFNLARAFVPNLGTLRFMTANPAVQARGGIEARTRNAESRFQSLVERIPVVTFTVSFENHSSEMYVSPQVESMLGYSAREWTDDPILWYSRLHRDDRERWNQEFSRTICSAEPFKGDYRFLAKDGRVVWVHGEVTIERDDDGQPSRLQGIGYDITELKRAEERQAELVDELKEINEQLNQFAYVASHDLKAPLRAISSLADWLSADYADKIGPAGQEQFLLLQGRVKRMSALIEGILRYSRISRQQEKKISVDVNLLLLEVKELVVPPAGMELRIAPGFPTMLTERVRLLQVFENLVSNAIKYMGKPTGQIDVGWEDAGDFWTFHVRDTGSGIEPKYFEKILQIFQTLTPRDERESTGIGLAVVKKNVDLLGGRVWVESKLGEGSTFFFSHPKAPSVELQPSPTHKSRA